MTDASQHSFNLFYFSVYILVSVLSIFIATLLGMNNQTQSSTNLPITLALLCAWVAFQLIYDCVGNLFWISFLLLKTARIKMFLEIEWCDLIVKMLLREMDGDPFHPMPSYVSISLVQYWIGLWITWFSIKDNKLLLWIRISCLGMVIH